MGKLPRGKPGRVTKDLLMIVLCAITSFWLLASPLIPITFDLSTTSGVLSFAIADLTLSAALSVIGVTLNHMAARNARVSVRRRRQ